MPLARVSCLVEHALDWAVAKSQGLDLVLFDDAFTQNGRDRGMDEARISALLSTQPQRGQWVIAGTKPLQPIPAYSTDQVVGAAVIDGEHIGTFYDENAGAWQARTGAPRSNEGLRGMTWQDGTTRLEAAMRCSVVSRVGPEIELPEALMLYVLQPKSARKRPRTV